MHHEGAQWAALPDPGHLRVRQQVLSKVASPPARRALTRAQTLGLWLAAGGAAGAAFLLLGIIELPQGPAFSICAFRRTTGIPCPGCGMTRALAALARGDLAAALHLHPFSPLVLAEGAALWGMVGDALLRQRPFAPSSRLVAHLLGWQGAAFLALWIGRLATGTLPW